MNIQEQFNQAVKSNDIKNVKLLLNDNRVNPSDLNNWAIIEASMGGHTDIVKLLLNDNRVNPAAYNWAIINASIEGHCDIVNLLWQDQRVKNSLKNDNEKLYNQLIKKDIKDKVEIF